MLGRGIDVQQVRTAVLSLPFIDLSLPLLTACQHLSSMAQVGLVVNFDLPRNPEPYLHRIGRSGRMGRKGTAINLVTEADAHQLREIEKHFGTHIDEMPADIADRIS